MAIPNEPDATTISPNFVMEGEPDEGLELRGIILENVYAEFLALLDQDDTVALRAHS
jgi:hypothetical protein